MDEPARRAPVVVLTALELEYAAVRRHLADGVHTRTHPSGTMFEVGRLPGGTFPVALGVTGEGNTSVAALTERAVAMFAPDALLFVGVAGALKDDLDIGDVVVATRVYAYHGGKEDVAGFRARPRAWEADHGLLQLAQHTARTDTWNTSPTASAPVSGAPRVHFKPIAAGAVLLNHRASPTALQIRLHYDDAAAVEMESAGFAEAGHLASRCPVLTIRGISDKTDGEKGAADASGSQVLAATHAAAFAAALIRAMATTGTLSARDLPMSSTREREGHRQVIIGAPGSTTYAVQYGNQYIHVEGAGDGSLR